MDITIDFHSCAAQNTLELNWPSLFMCIYSVTSVNSKDLLSAVVLTMPHTEKQLKPQQIRYLLVQLGHNLRNS